MYVCMFVCVYIFVHACVCVCIISHVLPSRSTLSLGPLSRLSLSFVLPSLVCPSHSSPFLSLVPPSLSLSSLRLFLSLVPLL